MERLKFAICHCKSKSADQIFGKIEIPVDPVIFKSWQEEDLYLEKPDADVYLASPDSAHRLLKLGYRIVGTTEDEELLLLKLPSAKIPLNPKVAISGRKSALITLFLREPQIFEAELLFTTCPDAEEKLKEGLVDLIIVPKEIAKNLKTPVEIVKRIPCLCPHILMAKPEASTLAEKKIAPALKLKPAPPYLERDLERLHAQSIFLEKYHRNRYITEHILKFPDTFVIIYRDKIVFASEEAAKLTGYSQKELLNLSLLDIIADDLREQLKPVMEMRLKGKRFKKIYKYLKLKRKNKSSLYLLALTDTIVYQGSYAGLIFGINVTQFVYLERLNNAIKSINSAILKSKTEDELFSLICEAITRHLDINLAWIGIKDETELKVLHNTLPEAKVPFGKDEPVFKALANAEVVIVENIQEEPKSPWIERALELGLLSSAYIPIVKSGSPMGVLALYSREPDYFSSTHIEALEEFKADLSIGVERLSLQKNLQLINEAIDRIRGIVIISEPDGRIIYANPQAQDTFGLNGNKEENILNLLPLGRLPDPGKSIHTYCAIRSPTGKVIHLEVDCHHITLSDGSPKMLVIARDITKESVLSREIEKLKYTDPVTGLPNTNAFSINVNRKLKEMEGKAAMIILHLKGLPQINFNYGLNAGDAALKKAAERLAKILMKKDIIARLDGSKFGILITDIKEQQDLLKVIRRIVDAMELPFNYNGDTIHLIPSIGVSIYPDDGDDFYTLYKNALAALHMAKDRRHSQVEFFNKNLKQIMEHFTSASQLVKEAVENGLFVFYYQPYFKAEDLSLAGFEALVRIVDKKGAIHQPSEFIDYLENSIYNRQFQKWAIEKAVEKIREWNTSISINISGRSFMEDDFIETINSIPDDVADKMVVEITERIMLKDINRSKRIMEKMKPKIKIAIDDFGTGYSSLLYLRELPADILKIDMQFVKDIVKGERELGIVRIMVEMAHTLDMEAVAEGVETERHLELLKQINCDYLQGFYLARPLPEEEAKKLLRK